MKNKKEYTIDFANGLKTFADLEKTVYYKNN